MRRDFFTLLAVGTCMCAMAAPVQAQTMPFAIARGPLKPALDSWAKRTGRQLVYKAGDVRDRSTAGATGIMSADAALHDILAGTGLHISVDPSGAIAISRATETSANAMEADAAGDIVVTGSRLRTLSEEAPNPVVSVDARQLQTAGTTNVTDTLTAFPALRGSVTSATTAGGGQGGGLVGLNILNLRNLGMNRTLVLVDGRRHVSAVPGSQSVDISSIPVDLIERVDVLTGGVSAIYGADGVTGVVNFVLKKDFDGISARFQNGLSSRGDAGSRFAGVTFGKNFAQGRGNIAVSYEYQADDGLRARARSSYSAAQNVFFVPNPDDPENQFGYTGPLDNGIPDNVPLRGTGSAGDSREGGIDVDFDFAPDFYTVNGRAVPYDYGRALPFGLQQGGSTVPGTTLSSDISPKIQRHNVNLISHFDVSPALTLFLEAKYARNRSSTTILPSLDSGLLITADNPYLPAGLPTLENGGILLNRWNFDLGFIGEDTSRETFRTVVGAKGELGPHARYELSYVFGQTDITSRTTNDQYTDRFLAAVDAVRDPATGAITCRANLDPDWTPDQPFASRFAEGAVTFAQGECVPFNPFGDGASSQASRDFIQVTTTDRARLRQQVVGGSITGDFGQFFALPGGPVAFAVGAEYRKEDSRYTPDVRAQQELTYFGGARPQAGTFDVNEQYAELRAPLLRDLPFAHRLEFGAAIRFSDYSTAGKTTTWKVDGSYAPISDISFNGTYSKAVRAPNISELFDAPAPTQRRLEDPCDANRLQNGSQFRAANCAAILTSLGVADPSAYADLRPPFRFGTDGGNTDLSPEEATTWTAGVVVQPRIVPGLTIRADWYDIKLRQAINTVSPNELGQLCVDQASIDNVFCRAITRQNGNAGSVQAGNVVSFAIAPQNVAKFRTAGLDLNINYRMQTRTLGTFSLNLAGGYLDRLEFISTPGGAVISRLQEGVTSRYVAPRYSANMDLTWTHGAVTLNYGLNWTDKTLRYSRQTMIANPDVVAPEFRYIKQLWQHDIYGSLTVNERLDLFGGVNNAFDRKPDAASGEYPISSIGRYLFIGARVRLPSF